MLLKKTTGYSVVKKWFSSKNLAPFAFQEETWQHIIDNKSGLVNAPTGCGKTFSVFIGSIIQFINEHPNNYKAKSKNGLQLLWITPLRALAKDIGRAMEEAIAELGMQWKVGIRNGDTEISESDPEADLRINEIKRHVQEAVKQLPKERKRIYLLSREAGMSRDEIASQLNISPSTVKNSIAAALKSIRDYLKGRGYEELIVIYFLMRF